MFSTKLKELTDARAKLASLEQAIASELTAELLALPSRYGFANSEDFIAAVRAAGGPRRGRGPGRKTIETKPPTKRRKRTVVTDEIRAEVKKLTKAEKTGAEIAKSLGISLPTVQNIRKALGLVKSRN